jgi:hypothetical protein
MSKFEKSMEDIFDIVPAQKEKLMPQVQNESLPASTKNYELDLDTDYEESRNTLKGLVKKGNDAIDHLLAIASETEHPRAFEVVATLIKNTVEANERLMTMQKSIREMKGMKSKESNVTVDKAIFVGSTKELSDLLKGKND